MKNKMIKKCLAIFILIVLMLPTVQVNAYLTEDGKEAEMIKLERSVSSTESMIGKIETITYNLTGDTIVYDPPKEIALVVDVSGSMDWSLSGISSGVPVAQKRITMLKNAAKNFVSQWQSRNAKICVVPFSTYVGTSPVLISMKDADCLTKLNATIDALAANGSTNLGDGMRVAYHTLNNSGNTDASKYVITLTDGEPNVYSCVSTTQKNEYYKGDGIIPSNRAISSSSGGLTYCTTVIGNMILNNDKFKSFVIGFATPTNLVTNLNSIGLNSGAKKLSTGNYFYYAGSQTELNQAYTDISNIIANDVPFTGALFSEVLPEGTIIDEDARPQLEALGFQIIDNYVDPGDPEHKVRTKISRSLSGLISLTRKYPTATTAPQDRVYQLKPYSFSITIIYTTAGTKYYKKEDAKVNYDDPFQNQAYTAYSNTAQTVLVNQPVNSLINTHNIVMVGQNEAPGRISAMVDPDTAYDRNIKGYKIVEAYDINDQSAGMAEIAVINTPATPVPLNQIEEVTGLKAGKVRIEAESQGFGVVDGNLQTIKGKSTVFVVDAAFKLVTMNYGQEEDLNNYAIKYVSNTTTEGVAPQYMNFKGWRLTNSADSEFVILDTSGKAKVIKTLEHNVEVLVDVNYTFTSKDLNVNLNKTISCFITAATPVEKIDLDDVILMAGTSKTVNAKVLPDVATNREIQEWTLLDESGIAYMEEATDPLKLNSVRVIGANKEKYGSTILRVEAKGTNNMGLPVIKEVPVYVMDAYCADKATATLWGSSMIIEHTSYKPNGLKGTIKFRFSTTDTQHITVNAATGEIKCKKLTEDGSPVIVNAVAEYYDEADQPTGIKKEFTCAVTLDKPRIDIN